MAGEVKAGTIGRAALRDLQIAVPVRPSVRRGVRLRAAGDTVMLDGSDRPQVFTGAFARDGLTRLVAACDGTRTHADLAGSAGLDASAVHTSVALLWASGVLEEAPPVDAREVAPPLACFLSRLGNSTGANRSWADGADRLARAAVHLGGDGPLVAAARGAFGDACAVVDDVDDATLTVFFETSRSRADLAALARRCREQGRPLLRVRADAGAVTVGPYVDPAFTPCLECGTAGEDAPADVPAPGAHDLVAGLVAHHVIALVSRATMTHLPLDASVVDLTTLATAYRASVSRPGCPACAYATGPAAATPPACAAYEAAVAIPPRRFLDPKGHLAHYQSSNIRLQAEFRSWPSRPQVALPALDPARLDAGAPEREHVGLDDVGLLLGIAFGIRESTADGWVKRWTAAAGNIGSATAYLACRDPRVLPVGVYAYVEGEHALARLSTSAPPGDRPLSLVVTANLRKVVRKYGTFGLRLALLDAGCALTGARAVAEAVGLPVAPEHDWDDAALGEHIGVAPGEEPVAAVLGVG